MEAADNDYFHLCYCISIGVNMGSCFVRNQLVMHIPGNSNVVHYIDSLILHLQLNELN